MNRRERPTSRRRVGRTPSGWSRHVRDAAPDRHATTELRHLAALEAIAIERSFRGAAIRLGYVQSAVSHQLAALERIVGARLVERSRRNLPVTLTEAGELMLLHATEVLASSRSAQTEIDALKVRDPRAVRVGVFQSVANNLLPRIVPVFARTFPDVQLIAVERQSDCTLFELLEAGEIDLTFCCLPAIPGPFVTAAVMEDPFVVLVRAADSQLAQRQEPLRVQDLQGLRLVGVSESRVQAALVERLSALGLSATFALLADMNSTMQSLVAEGLGVAVVPYMTIDPLVAETTILELAELPARRIGLAWHGDRPPRAVAERFIEMVQAAAPRFRTDAAEWARSP